MEYLIVAHDAGGAEILSSWVRRNPQNQYRFILGGPAVHIFSRKIPSITIAPVEKMGDYIKKSDFVLTGTSSSANLEKSAIRSAKGEGIKVASFLDYWYGYLQRFQHQGGLILPDEVWVGDEYALQKAHKTFPKIKIVFYPNPYLLDITEEKEKITDRVQKNNELNILYLCQPFNDKYTDTNGRVNLVTDIAALKYFFICLLSNPYASSKVHEIRIRPHPTEQIEKYRNVVKYFAKDFTITFSTTQDLVKDCVWADWAVGLHTMSLVVALTIGSNVFHCIPPGGRPCVLPQKEIVDFKTFIQNFP